MAKDTKLILRHTSGSKVGHVEEFPIDDGLEVALGRDESSNVKFDDSDDLVSRNHARLTAAAGDPPTLEITDLGSSNGTFVNRQRLSGSMAVKAGDVVQLGAGGPEMEIDLDPKPEGAKATRLATPAAAATRMAAEAPAKSGVGKATVERMLTDTRQKSKKQMLTFAAIGLAVLAVVVLIVMSQGREAADPPGDDPSDMPLKPAVIAAANEDAVVKIEMTWRLVHPGTGEQIYQQYEGNLPVYQLVGSGSGRTIQPMLVAGGGSGRPINGGGGGSGFVVTENGFILTNRHIAAGWDYRYSLTLPGVLYDAEGKPLGRIAQGPNGAYLESSGGQEAIDSSLLRDLAYWVPAEVRTNQGNATGRNDRLVVVFPKTKERIPARVIRISDRADVALIKIDIPTKVSSVELYDNYSTIAPGDEVVVMGYPGVSDEAMVVSRSLDGLRQQETYTTVPEPTVTVGGVGRVYRAAAQSRNRNDRLFTDQDGYQLTINATGFGNSGGPVFDDFGRVIGIFAWRKETAGAVVTGAVPIKHGIELLEIRQVVD